MFNIKHINISTYIFQYYLATFCVFCLHSPRYNPIFPEMVKYLKMWQIQTYSINIILQEWRLFQYTILSTKVQERFVSFLINLHTSYNNPNKLKRIM